MISFADALDAASGRPSSKEAAACVQAMTECNSVATFSEWIEELRHVQRHLEGELTGVRLGALTVGCLRAKHPKAICAWVFLIAPKAWKRLEMSRAKELYLDCSLILNDWVNSWNRNSRNVKRWLRAG